MTASHIHLLLNHFPTVGFAVGVAVFIAALIRRSIDLEEAGLVILFLTAAVTIATYVSGNDAQQTLKETSGVSDAAAKTHESAALVAFVFMQATGFFSWLGLWRAGRRSRIANWNLTVVLILAVATFGLMARAANLGGQIRHPEIQTVQAPSAEASVLTLARSWGLFVENHSWVWPTCETVHFIGLCMLFGMVLTVNLRMLGVGKSVVSFTALYQLLPLGILGFALNLITGMMFFVATPHQYTGTLFLVKMALVVAGALNLLYVMLFKGPRSIDEEDDAPHTTKVMAISAIVIWLGVLFCGHMLPWLGNSF